MMFSLSIDNKLKFVLLTLFVIVGSFYASAQKPDLRFKRISVQEGLSHSFVKTITQDYQGFMWFGTDDGLNKYDGYTITVYKHLPEDSTSINHSNIVALLEDKNKNLWVCTEAGVNLYHRNTDTFIRCPGVPAGIVSICEDSKQNIFVTANAAIYRYDKKEKKFKAWKSVPVDGTISAIYEDYLGNFWACVFTGQLYLLDKKTQNFVLDLKLPEINGIYEDVEHNFWIRTINDGLKIYDRKSKKITEYKYGPTVPNSLRSNRVQAILGDHLGRLLIGSENAGLSIFDKPNNKLYHYSNDPGDSESLSFNSINSIYIDHNKDIWLGTFSGGVNFVKERNFRYKYKNVATKNTLSSNAITSFCEDNDGNIWIGTDGGGLNKYNKETETFTHFYHDPKNPKSISADVITYVTKDSLGHIWLTYWLEGMSTYQPSTNTFTHYRYTDKHKQEDYKNDCFMYLYEDLKTNLWVGTLMGLRRFDKNKKDFISYVVPRAGNYVGNMLEDSKHNLWVGTYNGLHLLNPSTKNVTRLVHVDKDTTSLSNDRIFVLYEDTKKRLWLGTGGGLNLLDRQTKAFKVFDTRNGLPSDVIYGILEDDKGNLWLSTANGLCRFNPDTKHFKNFNMGDGLQGNEFKKYAFLKLKSGEFLFGGTNGFNIFDPNKITDNNFIPPVVITDFRIFNIPIVVGAKDSILKKHISETKELKLTYKHSVLSFDFAALNFIVPEKNQYAYRLEGFDKDWNYAGTKRTATYTNLDPGEYVLKIKGSNNDGKWNTNSTNLKISISPPYWQTWWFRALLICFVVGVFGSFYWVRITVANNQRKELEYKVKKRTEELALLTEEERNARRDAEKANQAKSVFLATMSHEIRTPMNGVIGMASLLAETNQTNEQQEYTEIIRNCGEALLTVINDILDFSKIESGNMELEQKDFDLRNCVEEVLDVFATRAAKVGLDLIYEIDYNVPAQIIGDSMRLRQVILNLVSNAIKFTAKGEIFVGVHLLKTNGDAIELGFEVRDTGIGIPADKLDRLFKAFSQVDSSTTRKYGGTGLGLVISEKLVGIMGGSIHVESVVDKGTTFTFTIQTQISHTVTRTYVHHNTAGLEGKKILVVDDNATNLSILKNQLGQWKLVPTLAMSGKEALTMLTNETSFDLVLADMQMPGMDGIDLAKAIKQKNKDLRIILLSSIGDDKTKVHDELFASVLTKPVKQNVLFKHIVAQLRPQKSVLPLEEPTHKKSLSLDFAVRFPLQILITEDNPINQKLAERVLTKLGYNPDYALNGQEALDAIVKKHYDVILMDVQMPVMDGLEATRQIRLRTESQPLIIAMTANAMQGDREMCVQAGMDDYISKPVRLEDLMAILEKYAVQIKAG